MKILILYQDWARWLDSNTKIFEFWAESMDGFNLKNHDYYILALSDINKNFNFKGNVAVSYYKSSPIRQFFDLFSYKKKLKKIIKEFQPDIIYTPFVYLNSVVPKSKSYKIISFVRENTPEGVKAKGGLRYLASYVFHLLDWLALRKTDLVVHNGKSMELYARRHGFKGTAVYAPRPIQDKEYFTKSKTIKYFKKTILGVCRLTKEKNVEMAIKALALLPKKYGYLHIGEGQEKEKLIKLAEDIGVIDRVKFLGFIDHKKLWSYYKGADYFCLLSKTDFEGTPNVVVEALYSGTPVIVSKISAMKNVIKHNKNGIILKNYDPENLARILQKKYDFKEESKKTIAYIEKERKTMDDLIQFTN